MKNGNKLNKVTDGIKATTQGPAKVNSSWLRNACDRFFGKKPGKEPTGLVPRGAKPLGKWGEDRLEVLLGGTGTKPAKAFMTSDGPRYIDRLLNGIAHEFKAGKDVKLANSIWRQILKDKELIEKGVIEGAHWHFWQGATKELLETLTANGIRFTVH
ncbi:hypothetical protein SH449x_001609 [Pirellulaceae bacterium SH449]